MPFIDLNTNNSVNSSVPQQASDTNSQSTSVNDDLQTGTPTPSASSLDFDRLAAEGALPVLPPTVTQQSAELQPTPAVSTLDLTADVPTMGNNVRQVQGANFDEPEIVTAVPEVETNFVDTTPVSDTAVPATDPVMEVVPAPSESETEAIADTDDLASVLETFKSVRADLAQQKPTSVPVNETAAVPPITNQESEDTQTPEATDIVEATLPEAGEQEFKLGIENTTTQSPATEIPVNNLVPVQDTASTVPTTNVVDTTPINVEPVVPVVEEVVSADTALTQPDSAVQAYETAQPVLEQSPAVESPQTLNNEGLAPQPQTEAIPEVVANTTEVLPALNERVSPSVESEPVSGSDLQSRTYSLEELLTEAVTIGASDLHLTAGYRALARLDGKLTELRSQILTHEDILTMLSDVVAPHVHVDLQHDLDIDISHQIANPKARFRVNIFYQQGTIGAVFRVIPEHIRTVEELRLPPLIKEFTTLPQGLVLVTGPTGSGKTTTLAALVNQINSTEAKHIITIEDPIEYVYPKGAGLVDQRAVYIDTPDWHTALRAVLRQDPNVVLIGEMRDVETMEAALTIAETGHLVFSTLHTNSAAQTIDRIIDAFPEEKQGQVRTQLAGVLMAVISQRLIPVSGGGRRAATEIMVVTPAIKNAIREQKVYQIDNIIQTSAELGMNTLEKSLVGLVREGVISPEVAQNYANRPEDVLTYLSKN